jgi:predicted nucleic acid-binding protein
MLLLDTNVYIDILDDPAGAERLARELDDAEDVVSVSSVVVAELLIGLRDPGERATLLADIVHEGDELLTPNHDDWSVAADTIRALGGNAATKRRSFWNDALIAASCARADVTLVTSNADDFRRIRKVIPVRTTPAWW